MHSLDANSGCDYFFNPPETETVHSGSVGHASWLCHEGCSRGQCFRQAVCLSNRDHPGWQPKQNGRSLSVRSQTGLLHVGSWWPGGGGPSYDIGGDFKWQRPYYSNFSSADKKKPLGANKSVRGTNLKKPSSTTWPTVQCQHAPSTAALQPCNSTADYGTHGIS